MKKKDLTNLLAQELEMPKNTAAKAVNLLFSSIASQLARGREVNIAGFGVFNLQAVKRKPAGQRKVMGALQVEHVTNEPSFRASKSLTQRVGK